MDPTIKDFEAAIAELESVVKQLEAGDLALETSLALYERGVQLSRFCHARLELRHEAFETITADLVGDRSESTCKRLGSELEPGMKCGMACVVVRVAHRPDRVRRCAQEGREL